MHLDLRLYKTGIALVVAACVLALLAYATANALGKTWHHQGLTLTQQHDKLNRQIASWEANAREAKSLSNTLSDEDISRLLDPMPSGQIKPMIEAMAATAHLTHLKIQLSEGQPWDGGETFMGIANLAKHSLSIEAEAPMDTNIYQFVESLPHIGGHLDFTEIKITRLPQDALAALNVHLTLNAFWYGNRSEKEVR